MLKETTQVYNEIIALLEKHKECHNFDIDSLTNRANTHLLGLKFKEVYGLNINPNHVYNLYWNEFGEYANIAIYDKERTIAWSDNRQQPEEGEELLSISFSSGAYIFNNSSTADDYYPVTLFNRLFDELRTYQPKYTDTHNHKLYFAMDNASAVFNNLDTILKKYYKLNKAHHAHYQIQRLEKELKEMKNENK